MKQLITTLAIVIVTPLLLTACTNTLQGIGKDTEAAGRAIQDTTK